MKGKGKNGIACVIPTGGCYNCKGRLAAVGGNGLE